MAKGHQSDRWNHTAELLAMMATSWLDGSWTPADFHPDTIAERIATPRPTGFNARFFAIRLCGPKAVQKFKEADAANEQRGSQSGASLR